MTGPEHYREAERLLDIATNDNWSREARTEAVPLAQVHATLALAAATALLGAFSAACLEDGIEDDTLTEWYEAASEIPSGGA